MIGFAQLVKSMSLPRHVRTVLFGILLLVGGFEWSPVSAEPCPKEWNAYVQASWPSQRAEIESWSDQYRYGIGTQGFESRHDIMSLGLGSYSSWRNDPRSLRKAAHVLAAAVSQYGPISAEYRYGACRALARADELERGSNRPSPPSPTRPSAPASRPNLAVKQAPAPTVAKTPTADPHIKTPVDRAVMDKITALIASYPKRIEPCAERAAGSIQPPCVKYNEIGRAHV